MACAPQRAPIAILTDSPHNSPFTLGVADTRLGRNCHTTFATRVDSFRSRASNRRYVACLIAAAVVARGATAIATNEDGVVQNIAAAIHRYVLDHPDAADSIDGIHRWWLAPALRDEPPRRVEAAVAQLVRERVLHQVVQEDGRVIYSSGQKP
jgi:hypothetical protein